MLVKSIHIAGREFVALYGEGRAGDSAGDQVTDLIAAFDAELGTHGLGLDNAVRQRLWMRDRSVRAEANAARSKALSGQRRSSSSSFFSAGRFLGSGDVAIDLIAQRPHATPARRAVEFEPPVNYLYYLVQDSVLFMSGIAVEAVTLDQQFTEILRVINTALGTENVDWRDVVHASVFLERGHETLDWVRERLAREIPALAAVVDYELVDGLANPGKHLEIEVTVCTQPTAERGGFDPPLELLTR
jgi:enamine deaminase RidA (YjgF/YER057c/UK114 family)